MYHTIHKLAFVRSQLSNSLDIKYMVANRAPPPVNNTQEIGAGGEMNGTGKERSVKKWERNISIWDRECHSIRYLCANSKYNFLQRNKFHLPGWVHLFLCLFLGFDSVIYRQKTKKVGKLFTSPWTGKEFPQQITLGFYIICEFTFHFSNSSGGLGRVREHCSTENDQESDSIPLFVYKYIFQTFQGAPPHRQFVAQPTAAADVVFHFRMEVGGPRSLLFLFFRRILPTASSLESE